MKSSIAFKSLLVVCLLELCARPASPAYHQPVAIGDPVEEKLDKILFSLEVLTNKQDQFEQLLQRQHPCQCPQTVNAVPGASSEIPQRPVSGEQKHEETSARDLFHFNKLAVNSIPSSSSPWNQADESSLADWLSHGTAQITGDETPVIQLSKEQLVMLGDQLESTFGGAFGNLTYLVREQLAAFRMTLTKLMNRQIDHSYQYNTISNQISSLREECSLAASQLQTVDPQSPKVSPGQANDQRQSADEGSLIKSTDVTAVARLLSQELNQLVNQWTQRQMIKGADAEQELVSHLDEQLDLVNKSVIKKLDEIDSVVKQSVLLLLKLNSQAKQAPVEHQVEPVVLTYTNTNSSSSGLPGNSTQTSSRSRWFAGSKVPGKGRDESLGSEKEQKPIRRCQSKTSLVRPTSCQQLRLAGANCSGQYYVFVRGSIKHVYCDMNMDSDDEGGGWTVVLRRIDKSRGLPAETNAARRSNHLLEAFKAAQENFELNWANYKRGFGHLDEWGEFFIGLDLLNQMTNESIAGSSSESTKQVEMQIDIDAFDGVDYHLRFDRFQVGGEDSQYQLGLGACNSSQTLCGPLLASNGSSFQTMDRLSTTGCPGEQTSKAGWWWAGGECADQRRPFGLTLPIGRQVSGSVAALSWPDDAIQVKRLVMKIRTRRAKPLGLQM